MGCIHNTKVLFFLKNLLANALCRNCAKKWNTALSKKTCGEFLWDSPWFSYTYNSKANVDVLEKPPYWSSVYIEFYRCGILKISYWGNLSPNISRFEFYMFCRRFYIDIVGRIYKIYFPLWALQDYIFPVEMERKVNKIQPRNKTNQVEWFFSIRNVATLVLSRIRFS